MTVKINHDKSLCQLISVGFPLLLGNVFSISSSNSPCGCTGESFPPPVFNVVFFPGQADYPNVNVRIRTASACGPC